MDDFPTLDTSSPLSTLPSGWVQTNEKGQGRGQRGGLREAYNQGDGYTGVVSRWLLRFGIY